MAHYLSAAMVALLLPGFGFAELTPAERAALGKLDSARVIADLQRYSTGVVKTRSGAGAGTAVAGSAEERTLAAAIEQDMKKLGLKTRQEKFPVRAYQYGEVTLTANGVAIPAVSLHAAGGTWGKRDGVPYARGNEGDRHRVRAALVDVGEGYAADYDRAGSVQGKVVLVRRSQGWPVSQILEAAHRGAAAMVMYDYPQAPDTTIKQDSMWYHEQVPLVSISKAKGVELQTQLKQKPVEIVLENRIDSEDGFSQNVIGTITGSDFPDEWVIISAHYDRWWQSAQDNCVSVASMLEMARALTSIGYRPRRSIMFLSTGGEEAGVEATEQDWLAGSWAFTTAHPEILRRLVYDFNMDLVGWTSSRGVLVTTPDAVPSQRQLIQDVGMSDHITVQAGLGNTTDAWNFGITGGGAAGILRWTGVFTGRGDPGVEPDPFARYYHTQEDLYHAENYKNLPDHLKIGLLSLLRADQTTLAPVDFTEVASWVSHTLDSDGFKVNGKVVKNPSVSFEAAQQAALDFSKAADSVKTASSRATSVPQAGPLNLWLMRTRKDLMPWLFSQGAALRTSGYATTVASLAAARMAAEKGDRAGVLDALARVNNLRTAVRVSPDVARDERLYWYTSGDWASAFYQKQRPVDPALDEVYRRISTGADLTPEVPRLKLAEDEARGHLSEAIFIVAGKLRTATAALKETPLP